MAALPDASDGTADEGCVTGAEAEYAAAKCAYTAALERLRLAKAALPPHTPSAAKAASRAANRRRNETICSRYRAGTAAHVLAADFKLSVNYIRYIVYHSRPIVRIASETFAVSRTT